MANVLKSGIRVFKRIFFILFLILPIILITYTLAIRASGGIPSVFGYSLNIVITPSMQDVLPVGSVILSRDYDGESELHVGEIVTYLGEDGTFAGKMITHEVRSVTVNDDGETVIVTKGTQNAVADTPIRPDMIRSVYICKIVELGKFYEFVANPIGFILLCIIPILIFIVYELFEIRGNITKGAVRKNDWN